MKAFLLAAGKGTRLKPYTDTRPKCLIPIHGRPLLDVWLDLFERHGISEVLINTHHHADQVAAFIESRRSGTALRLQTAHEPCLLGSAGTIRENRAFAGDATDFVIAYADNLTNVDLTKMIDIHRHFSSKGGLLTMGLIRAPNPRECGIVTLDAEERIVRFEEKPERPQSDLANGGIYIASHQLWDYFDLLEDFQGQPLDLGHHLLPHLVGKMYGYRIDAYLRDIGSPQAYHQALAEWPANA